MTCDELKRRVELATGIPCDCQRLLFNMEELTDGTMASLTTSGDGTQDEAEGAPLPVQLVRRSQEVVEALAKLRAMYSSDVWRWYKRLPEHVRDDREITLAAVAKNGLALRYASAKLREDRDVVLAAIAQNASALQYAPAVLQADRDFVLAADQ